MPAAESVPAVQVARQAEVEPGRDLAGLNPLAQQVRQQARVAPVEGLEVAGRIVGCGAQLPHQQPADRRLLGEQAELPGGEPAQARLGAGQLRQGGLDLPLPFPRREHAGRQATWQWPRALGSA